MTRLAPVAGCGCWNTCSSSNIYRGSVTPSPLASMISWLISSCAERALHIRLCFNAHSWGPSPTHGVVPFPFVFDFRATLLFAPVCLRLGIGTCLLTCWCYVIRMMNITLALTAPSFKALVTSTLPHHWTESFTLR